MDGKGLSSEWQSRRRLNPAQQRQWLLQRTDRSAAICEVGPLRPSRPARPTCKTIGETVILLHPPLPLAGASIGMERERQQNDSLLAHQDLHDRHVAAINGCHLLGVAARAGGGQRGRERVEELLFGPASHRPAACAAARIAWPGRCHDRRRGHQRTMNRDSVTGMAFLCAAKKEHRTASVVATCAAACSAVHGACITMHSCVHRSVHSCVDGGAGV